MNTVVARCLMCGKTFDVTQNQKDYRKLAAKEKAPTFICDRCSHKVRFETEEQNKPKKPM